MCKVSIIMSVYNTSYDYLLLCVNSILNQTMKDFEFIIYNDGSNEKCSNDLRQISLLDKRIRLIESNINKGLAPALNICLKLAKGDIIARMDSDDYCDKNRLKRQIEFLEKSNFDIVGCNLCYFDEKGVYGSIDYPENVKNKDFLSSSPIAHPTVVGYKSAFESCNGYSEKKYCVRTEDYDLFMRMYSSGKKIGNLQEYLYYFREDENAIGRRKYRYRFNEAIVKLRGFNKLKLYPRGLIYVIKPLIVGLLPRRIYKKYHFKKMNKNISNLDESH